MHCPLDVWLDLAEENGLLDAPHRHWVLGLDESGHTHRWRVLKDALGLEAVDAPRVCGFGQTRDNKRQEVGLMYRWLAYSGGPQPLEWPLFEVEHSPVDQSLDARMAPKPTNGDGIGLGGYGRDDQPGAYRCTQPAWNDGNLHDLAHHIESQIFFAHVRRASGTPLQQSNCHFFRHGNWLFVHNGPICGCERIRRDMRPEATASSVDRGRVELAPFKPRDA